VAPAFRVAAAPAAETVQAFPRPGTERPGGPGAGLGVNPAAGSAMLNLHHILGLRTLFPFHNLEFDFLALLQGAKAFALDVTVVDEDIGPVGAGNKTIAFGIAEPFDLASYPHGTLTSNNACLSSSDALPKK